VVPPVPGNLSALGFVTARARLDLVRTMLMPAHDGSLGEVAAAMEALAEEGVGRLVAGGLPGREHATIERALGVRIRGQSFDLQVPVAEVPHSAARLTELFREAYQARYAYLPDTAALEIVSVRIIAFGPQAEVNVAGQGGEAGVSPSRRSIYTVDGWREAGVFRRSSLRIGERIEGPAIIRESGATTVMGSGWNACIDTGANLVLRRG